MPSKGVIVAGRFEGDGHPLRHAACGKGAKAGKLVGFSHFLLGIVCKARKYYM
jgi:hypothetical protein